MSDEFLKNPLSLFEVKGKTAIITGASGAFGALAAKTLAGAGANVVLAASKQDELKKVAAECEALGAKAAIVALAAELGRKLRENRQGRGRHIRPARHFGGRVGLEQSGENRRSEAAGFS